MPRYLVPFGGHANSAMISSTVMAKMMRSGSQSAMKIRLAGYDSGGGKQGPSKLDNAVGIHANLLVPGGGVL